MLAEADLVFCEFEPKRVCVCQLSWTRPAGPLRRVVHIPKDSWEFIDRVLNVHTQACAFYSEMHVMFETRWLKCGSCCGSACFSHVHVCSDACAVWHECVPWFREAFGSDVWWDFRVVVDVTTVYCYKTSLVYSFQEAVRSVSLCLELCRTFCIITFCACVNHQRMWNVIRNILNAQLIMGLVGSGTCDVNMKLKRNAVNVSDSSFFSFTDQESVQTESAVLPSR